MSEHALLNPSSAQQWLNCTKSARLQEKLPNVSSQWADEGSLAHELGAVMNLLHLKRISVSDAKVKVASVLLTAQQKSYDWKAMKYYVAQYVDFCISKISKKGVTFIEERVDLSRYIPEGFGTSDFGHASPGIIRIVDYKHGEGVQISAENNPQMKIYALGMLEIAEMYYSIDRVEMTIHQPRLDNISTSVITVKELKEWALDVVMPKAALAFAGKGEFKAGAWCRFCRAKSRCKTLANYNTELARYDFQSPDLLTLEHIGKILSKADGFINWINAVKAYALDRATHGENIPGHKMVQGKSNRIWVDEEATLKYLLDCGYDKKELTETKIKSITKLEQLLGKGEFHKILSKFILKPKGAPTLVPLSDSRPALNSAEDAINDFKHLKI